jgi:hypothetical protein
MAQERTLDRSASLLDADLEDYTSPIASVTYAPHAKADHFHVQLQLGRTLSRQSS